MSSSASHHIPFLPQTTNGQFSPTPLGHYTNTALLSAREVRTLSSFLKALTETTVMEDIPRFLLPSDFSLWG